MHLFSCSISTCCYRVADCELEEDEDTDRMMLAKKAGNYIVAKYSGANSQVGFVNDHVILVVIIVTSVRYIHLLLKL